MSESWMTFTENDLARIRHDAPVGQVDFHEALDSTNDRALQIAEQAHQCLPLLILAQHQTRGRGRGTNHWYSASGSLTFSLLCDLTEFGLSARDFPYLSLVSALALRAAIVEVQPACQPQLKWPNDVYLNGRKVAGLLLEPVPFDSRLVVIGAGVNVNGAMDEAPTDIQQLATSLWDATKTRVELPTLLVAVVCQMIGHYRRLAREKQDMLKCWRSHCYLDGQHVELQIGQQRIRGRCRGIDTDGALLIENEVGRRNYYAGSVRVRS